MQTPRLTRRIAADPVGRVAGCGGHANRCLIVPSLRLDRSTDAVSLPKPLTTTGEPPPLEVKVTPLDRAEAVRRPDPLLHQGPTVQSILPFASSVVRLRPDGALCSMTKSWKPYVEPVPSRSMLMIVLPPLSRMSR